MRKMLTFLIPVVSLLFFTSAFAASLPDGFPRSTNQWQFADDVETPHRGFLRLVENRDANEILAIWRTGIPQPPFGNAMNQIRGQRLDGNTFEPLGGSFEIFRTVDSTGIPLDDPFNSSFHMDNIMNVDAVWDPARQQYLLTALFVSREREPQDPTRILTNYRVVAGYADPETLEVPLDEFEDLGSCAGETNSYNGLRAIFHPAAGGRVHVFWNYGVALTAIQGDEPPDAGICGRMVLGKGADNIPSMSASTRVLMQLDDKTDGPEAAFAMTQLAVAYDTDRDRFLLASVVGEYFPGFEGDSRSLKSYIGAIEINPGLNHVGTQGPKSFTVVANTPADFSVVPPSSGIALLPSYWPLHAPRLIKGAYFSGSDTGEFLLTFNQIYSLDDRRSQDDFQTRIRVSDNILPAGAGVRLGQNHERSSGSSTFRPNHDTRGLWLPEHTRFLVPWSSSETSTQSGIFGNTVQSGNGAMSAQQPRLFSNELSSVSGVSDKFVAQVIRSLDGRQLFIVGQGSDRVVVQPLEMRWHDLVVETQQNADTIPFETTAEYNVTVSRIENESIRGFVGDFDSEEFLLHVTPSEGLQLTVEDPLEGAPLAEGETQTFDVSVTNGNSSTIASDAGLSFAIESSHGPIDYNVDNDVATMGLTLAGNPEGIEPSDDDDGDATPPGDDDGDTTPPGGDDDDITPPGDDDDEDNTGNTPPGGGGALGWLLLGLAGFTVRRQRMR